MMPLPADAWRWKRLFTPMSEPVYAVDDGFITARVNLLAGIPKAALEDAERAARKLPATNCADVMYDNHEVLMFELVVTAGLIDAGLANLASARAKAMRHRLENNWGDRNVF